MSPQPASDQLRVVAVFGVWLAFNLATVALIDTDESPDAHRRLRLWQTARLFEEYACDGAATDGTERVRWRYRLCLPRGRLMGRLPVVFYLHGAGERGEDNTAQLIGLPEHLARRATQRQFPCLVVAPQCPEGSSWTSCLRPAHSGQRGESPALLKILDEVLTRPDADLSRVYLVGYSMGAYGAWELAMHYPQRFAAVVPVAGGGDLARVGILKDVAVWGVHGADDRVVPPDESRRMIAALRQAGGSPRYSELSGVGHRSVRPGLIESDEVLTWMFE